MYRKSSLTKRVYSLFIAILMSMTLVGCYIDPGPLEETKQAIHTKKLIPTTIPLPKGFAPEGVARGYGPFIYAGSLADGSILKVNVITGKYKPFVAPLGRMSVGMHFDRRRNLLFVAGGVSGYLSIFHGTTGKMLASYKVPTVVPFVNDIIVHRDTAYITDSFNPIFYKLPLGRRGKFPPASALKTISLSGDFVQTDGFNANGIVLSPDKKSLLIVHSSLGTLFQVNPNTGKATTVDLQGDSLSSGDGMLIEGRTLYVMRNGFDWGGVSEVSVVRLHRSGSKGEVVRGLTHPKSDYATTIASFGPFLYTVNARFGTPATPDTTYDMIRFKKR